MLVVSVIEKIIDYGKVLSIINVSGNTSGNNHEIEQSILGESEFLKVFVKELNSKGQYPKVAHLSSVATKYAFASKPPYEEAKYVSEKILKSNNVLDFNIYIGYVKGLGEKKMRSAVNNIWPFFSTSHLMCSIKTSVVDVERLAIYFLFLIEGTDKITDKCHGKCVDVFISNGTIVFGEMLRALFPEAKKKSIPLPLKKSIMNELMERIQLCFRGLILEIFKPNDQLSRRIAHFMKLAAGSEFKIFEKKYNNLDFFGRRPHPEAQKVFVSNALKMVFRKEKINIPQIYFDDKTRLMYIFDELSYKKIIGFILK